MKRHVTAELAGWIPDRSPTWIEVIIIASVVVQVPVVLTGNEPVSTLAVALGFFVTVVAVGPVAHSSVGKVVGRWFRDIGKRGRATAIVAYAVGVWITNTVVGIPVEVFHAGFGSLLAGAVFMLAHVLTARTVSGWIPSETPDE